MKRIKTAMPVIPDKRFISSLRVTNATADSIIGMTAIAKNLWRAAFICSTWRGSTNSFPMYWASWAAAPLSPEGDIVISSPDGSGAFIFTPHQGRKIDVANTKIRRMVVAIWRLPACGGRDGSAGYVMGLPHFMQNLACSGFVYPQYGQVTLLLILYFAFGASNKFMLSTRIARVHVLGCYRES